MMLEFEANAVFGLALLSFILASGAFILALHKPATVTVTQVSQPLPTTPTPDTASKTKSTSKKEKDDDSSSDEEDADKDPKDKDTDKEKEKDKHEIIDEAYKLIHQRYNRKDYKWEDFDPVKDAQTHEGVIFIVYHRHYDPTAVRPLERLVELHSENLKEVLRGCVKHVDAVFDPMPLIDAQKLFNQEPELLKELEKLREKLKQTEGGEETETKNENPEKEVAEDQSLASKDSTVRDESSVPANGHLDGKSAKDTLLNGITSLDSDSTAVNTPNGSVTPTTKESSVTVITETVKDDSPVEASTLRLQVQHLEKLIKFLDKEFAPTRQKLKDLAVTGEIKFSLLWALFRLGGVITFRDNESGLVMAGEITSADYLRRGDSQEYFDIQTRYIDYNGSCFYYAWQRLELPFFKDLRKIRSLTASPLLEDGELKEQLKSRGADFVKMKGTHYLEYHDSVYQRRNFGLESRILKFRADGRAMVDCSSYQKMNPDSYLPEPDEEDKIDEVAEEELHFCAPTVFGYSFVTKMWGRLVADKFSDIVWNKTAFQHLVLPETTKTLIKSLVDADRANADIIKDVITGKGGGCIVILHGRPGTGKTLTAEAIAEERQKPLMVISVGELGRDASELEQKLTDILEIAKLWEAVLLLDEADVFLEARSLHELQRNAMVGVFLRLLEYHQRVMFLTTNRVTTLDEAFKSRISIAIKYRDLDKDARRQVWENFLGLAGVKIIKNKSLANGVDTSVATISQDEVNKLASKKLNGREIKNTTRTAQALAVSLKQPVSYDLLKQVLDVGEQFDKDFKEIDTSGMYVAKGEEIQDHHALYQ